MLGVALEKAPELSASVCPELADELDVALARSAESWASARQVTDASRELVRDAPVGMFVDPDECKAVLAAYHQADRLTRARAAYILGEMMDAAARDEISRHITGELRDRLLRDQRNDENLQALVADSDPVVLAHNARCEREDRRRLRGCAPLPTSRTAPGA